MNQAGDFLILVISRGQNASEWQVEAFFYTVSSTGIWNSGTQDFSNAGIWNPGTWVFFTTEFGLFLVTIFF